MVTDSRSASQAKLEQRTGQQLPAIARSAIARALGLPQSKVDESDEALHLPGACFVTLMQHGKLRGCVGSLEARTLLADVKANAVAAALQDTRFLPLTPLELPHTQIEVSLLSPMQSLVFHTEAEALALLRPGVDGLVLRYRAYCSTFLPQVWAQLPTPADFLAHLKYKAGLAPDFWANDLHLQRYTVSQWKEGEAL